MLSGRVYITSFQNVTISAVQDAFSIINGATKIIGLNKVVLGQITATSVNNLRLRIRRGAATVTQGSGGTVPTPTPLESGGTASGSTVHANDTVQAGASAIVDLNDEAWAIPGGYVWVPTDIRRPPTTRISEIMIVSLDTAPSPTVVANGSAEHEEIG